MERLPAALQQGRHEPGQDDDHPRLGGPGGEAVIETNGVENRCTQGASFVVADTTITCDVVGDRKVELSSVRR